MHNNFFFRFFPYFLILLAIAGRFFPHPANATPIAAVAIFSGLYLRRRLGIIVPLAAMLLSDTIIGFYSLPIMLSVYGSFASVGLAGAWTRKHKNVFTIGTVTISSSALFFLVTNWAVWQFGAMYAHTFAGLMESYAAGLPFWRSMLAGDVVYTTLLVGSYELVMRAHTIRARVAQKAG
ncbi:MAG: hypothetical protein HY981_02910 [Candidatus Magasanikbacteria bacterium]|nr:hypothetical protein [Candidatus Magasanikbacteria bacterium]